MPIFKLRGHNCNRTHIGEPAGEAGLRLGKQRLVCVKKNSLAVKRKIHPEGVKFTPEKWYSGARGGS